jgi:hypothetical protein
VKDEEGVNSRLSAFAMSTDLEKTREDAVCRACLVL